MPITSPVEVEERPAGVARIDRDVGLDERHVGPSGSERPLALTMPAVTEFSKPNGEPIATTHSPTLQRCAGRRAARSAGPCLDLEHGDVGLLVGADAPSP